MAAITDFRPGKEMHEGSGFVIVTAAAEAGMVDVHDRRPVVLSPVQPLVARGLATTGAVDRTALTLRIYSFPIGT
jgi:hypothetical protein